MNKIPNNLGEGIRYKRRHAEPPYDLRQQPTLREQIVGNNPNASFGGLKE
jgi:hypothetical protein